MTPMIKPLLISLALLLSPLFGSSLPALISYGLKHSPAIQVAKAQTRLSRLSREASKAARYGEFNLVGDYTHYNIEHTLAPLPPGATASATPITTTTSSSKSVKC